eukprot:COSAG03_NODE_14806_length_451_cov_0.965909_1_plen_48_part_00
MEPTVPSAGCGGTSIIATENHTERDTVTITVAVAVAVAVTHRYTQTH